MIPAVCKGLDGGVCRRCDGVPESQQETPLRLEIGFIGKSGGQVRHKERLVHRKQHTDEGIILTKRERMLWDKDLDIGVRQNAERSFARVEPFACQPVDRSNIVGGVNSPEIRLRDRAKRQGLVGAVLRKGEKELASVIEEERRVC